MTDRNLMDDITNDHVVAQIAAVAAQAKLSEMMIRSDYRDWTQQLSARLDDIDVQLDKCRLLCLTVKNMR